ncbi:MAG: hypothetical protein K1X64_02330 [Myxococcaceae bacterium]|nr:hypothetical protein [Myxococcaceae bacterium]
MKALSLVALAAFFATAPAQAYDSTKPSLSINAGLIQPLLLRGANVEVDFRWRYVVISYSHGWSLYMGGATVVGEAKAQNIELRLPFSTGLGIGGSFYSQTLNSFFELRLEPKVHRFEVSYLTGQGASVPITQYTTMTLGAGAYWTFVPFASRVDAWRGLNLSTSVRYWPNIASTLPGNAVEYDNALTGRRETHRTANIGMAGTPLLVNISLGYVFQ